MSAIYWFATVAAIVFGAMIGSFLNVVIHRLPAGESIVSPSSRCPTCGESIAWYDNVPVVSWFLLDGECRHCGAEIPLQYPLVEMLMAVLSGMLWVKIAGPVFAGASTPTGSLLAVVVPYFLHFTIVSVLVTAAAVDLEHYVVPHRLTLPGMAVAVAMPWLTEWLFGVGYIASTWPPVTPWESGIGWLGGGLTVVIIYYAYYAVRGVEGLGGGDVTLMAFVGAWLGWPALVFVFFAASAQGTLAAGVGRWVDADWISSSRTLYDPEAREDQRRREESEGEQAETAAEASHGGTGGDDSAKSDASEVDSASATDGADATGDDSDSVEQPATGTAEASDADDDVDGDEDDTPSAGAGTEESDSDREAEETVAAADADGGMADGDEDRGSGEERPEGASDDGDDSSPSASDFREVGGDEEDQEEFVAIPFGPFIVLSALEYFYFGEYLPVVLTSKYLYRLAGL